mgnify:CR=1 FL=1
MPKEIEIPMRNGGSRPRALIFDLDGCVVNSAERARTKIDHAAKARGDYERYYRSLAVDYSGSCAGDVPIARGMEMLEALRKGLAVERAIALTMRGEESRAATYAWLSVNLPFPLESGDLYMSPGRWADAFGNYYDPDARNPSAVEFKRETALDLMTKYEIVLALDDHPDICVMYREIGIPALVTLYPEIDCLTPVGDRTLFRPCEIVRDRIHTIE